MNEYINFHSVSILETPFNVYRWLDGLTHIIMNSNSIHGLWMYRNNNIQHTTPRISH